MHPHDPLEFLTEFGLQVIQLKGEKQVLHRVGQFVELEVNPDDDKREQLPFKLI